MINFFKSNCMFINPLFPESASPLWLTLDKVSQWQGRVAGEKLGRNRSGFCRLLWRSTVTFWAKTTVSVVTTILLSQEQLSGDRVLLRLSVSFPDVMLVEQLMYIKVKYGPSGYLNSILCSLVRWFLLHCIESPSEHSVPYYALEMNLDGTNSSITWRHKVERTYSPVSPVWHICLLLNLPSLCIIRS